jgi:two-component system, NtrC family, response regulator HydG
MPQNSILIIDDDPDVLGALEVLLEDDFTTIVAERSPNRLDSLLSRSFNAILLDMNFSAGINSGNEGLFWLNRILKSNPAAVVIMMTAYGKIDLAVEAIKRGAKDFVLKPWDNEKLLATVRAAIASGERKATDHEEERESPPLFVHGDSKKMRELIDHVDKVAGTDASVLLLGENGTGKEMIAREIHQRSSRSSGPFVTVDMSTLTPTLFESELFGHKKGAFTDARSDRKGRLEVSTGGTLFLDEIGNLSTALQAKLLTALQTKTFVPVGGNTSVSLNARIISATNASLDHLVSAGDFRRDLLYRINTITLQVPPLRDRPEDVVPLAVHFLHAYSSKYHKKCELDLSAKKALAHHVWPGNIRELQHTIEKAVILSDSEKISSENLNLSISGKTPESASRTLDDIEKDALQRALAEHGGNIVQAAKALGITRQTFYNKLKKYGI